MVKERQECMLDRKLIELLGYENSIGGLDEEQKKILHNLKRKYDCRQTPSDLKFEPTRNW